MKILVIDSYRLLLDLCLKAEDAGHEVRWWVSPLKTGEEVCIGDGYFQKVKSWEPHMKWADLIILGENAMYHKDLGHWFNKGFPIFGCNPKAAQLELDRGLGQKVCDDYNIPTLPFEIFTSYDDAIKHVEKTKGEFVCKPWGGADDKSLSYVAGSPEDMIFKLMHWKKCAPLKGKIMLQEKADGIEMAVGGWFGKAGWSQWLCENFEEKKFMNENLGQNTGEQGTTLRYTKMSKLFEDTLEPVTAYLHKIDYRGYVDMNTIVQPNGRAWPLEFTMRFGYPLESIQRPLHRGDPVEWMLDSLEGRDTLMVSEDISVGVVLSHGKYPNSKDGDAEECGFPLYGLTPSMDKHVHLSHAQWGPAPARVGSNIKMVEMPLTAGCFVAIVTGTGATVSEASEAAYTTLWKIKPPSNRMFRTDIGKRLKEQLPLLQSKGYAKGMKY